MDVLIVSSELIAPAPWSVSFQANKLASKLCGHLARCPWLLHCSYLQPSLKHINGYTYKASIKLYVFVNILRDE